MSMSERNAMQMRMAAVVARRRGIDLLTALVMIAAAFAAQYPNSTR